MRIKITPKFSKADVDKFVKEKKAAIERAVISMLQRVGEEFITNARNKGSYKDQTGNLRSSVGYVVMKNGLQLSKGGFVKIEPNKSKGGKLVNIINGPKVGEKLVEEISKELRAKYLNAIILIVVAGMHYAAAVEAKGFDVITGSSQIAEKELKQGIERIRTKISKAA
jgi:hypothetical protein